MSPDLFEKKPRLESPLLSVPEAYEYLRVSQSTLYLLLPRLETVSAGEKIPQ